MQAKKDIPHATRQAQQYAVPYEEKQKAEMQQYLIEQCLAGDSKAQYQLYRLYADAMYNLCRRLLKDEDEAKDMLQEGFVEAFHKLHTFRFEASFGAWLKRIVLHKCINLLQKKKLLTISIEDSKSAKKIAEETEDFSYLETEVRLVHEAVHELPEGCRVVLNLYLFEGYDHAEIAEILQISESTSKAQYSKARKRLREIIEQKKK